MFNSAGANTQVARQPARQVGNVGASLAAATGFDVRHASGLQAIVPEAAEVDELVYVYSSDSLTGDYYPLYDASGEQVSFLAFQATTRDLPEALFSCHFVKFVGDTTFEIVLLGKG